VQVDWKVATESGIERYEVERSFNGIDFKKVGEIAAKGNGGIQSYSFTDANAVKGNNYYRVRSVESDGKNLLSKVVVVKIANDAEIKVYPNPVKNQEINLQVTGMEKGQYLVMLINTQGQQVLNKTLTYNGYSSTEKIALNEKLPAGLYYLNLISGQQRVTASVFIQ
jgi:hypothetical protein